METKKTWGLPEVTRHIRRRRDLSEVMCHVRGRVESRILAQLSHHPILPAGEFQ